MPARLSGHLHPWHDRPIIFVQVYLGDTVLPRTILSNISPSLVKILTHPKKWNPENVGINQ